MTDRLDFFLRIGATGSCVPYRSLSQSHAAFMPDAGWAISRHFPNPCSRDTSPNPGFDVALGLTTRHQRFTRVRLLETHLTEYSSAFSNNAHHQGSLPSQLAAVWNLLLQADSGGPSPISDKAFTAHNLASPGKQALAVVREFPERDHAVPLSAFLLLTVSILESRLGCD
jgi:hypothetical protein